MSEDLIVDAQHPWPWLEAFPEYAAAFFNGRDEDAEALLRCVLAAPVTVLFGKSGLGKSSLLQAGLFPGLRKERLLPVYVRLVHESGSAFASEQIAKRLEEEIRGTQDVTNGFIPLAYRLRESPLAPLLQRGESGNKGTEVVPLTDSLWAELHRADIELADTDGRRWHPVFVLDQFEEIFTLATDPERQKQTFYELGDLIENRIPKALAERLHADDELYDQLNLDTQNYRFLLSLREDYLPDLEEWADLIPRLGPNRYRLLPMSATKAIYAVEKTGGALVTHEDAKNIVEYLSKSLEVEKPSGAYRRQRTQALVEPALLSLICSGLNDYRLKNNQPRLATNNLSIEGGLIVERFYDEAFKDQSESLRQFVEQYLITSDGVRLRYPVHSAVTEKLATVAEIQTLEKRRLIRRESLEEGDLIELIHDNLSVVVRQARDRRLTAEKQRRDKEKEELERYRAEDNQRRVEEQAERKLLQGDAEYLTKIANTKLASRLSDSGPKKILACDGGGIQGLMSVEILAKIEADLRVKLGRGPDFVLADYFDFVCGTGTGAFIAACISAGMSMLQIQQFYVDIGKVMFDKASVFKRLQYSYNSEPMANMLRTIFDSMLGEINVTMGSEHLRTLLMMVVHNHTLDLPWPVSNNPYAKYNNRLRQDCNLNLPLWQIVRASNAAPTYFPPEVVTFAEGTPEEFNFIFVGGEMTGYNNPAYLAFQMATAKPYRINWPTGSDQLLVVSIGTGIAHNARPNLGVDDMNLIHFAKYMPSALMNAASAGWDMTCRTLGVCRHGAPIDREIGDMVSPSPNDPNWTGPKLFTYLRYDPNVTFEGLKALGLTDIDPAAVQVMDYVDHIPDIRRVGIAYADQHVKIEHFRGFDF